MQNFVKICPVGAELLHADGQKDMTKLTVVFRNFVKAPEQVANTSSTRQHSDPPNRMSNATNDISLSMFCSMITSGMKIYPAVPLHSKLAALISENYKGQKYTKQLSVLCSCVFR